MSYANFPPKYMTTLNPKLLPLLSQMTKDKPLSNRHLLNTGRANLLILIIIIIIITSTIISILFLRSL